MGDGVSQLGSMNNSFHKGREWKVKRKVKRQIKKGNYWIIYMNSLNAIVLCKPGS